MNNFKLLSFSKSSLSVFCLALFLIGSTQAWSAEERTSPTPLILSNIAGNIWVETDANSTYNGEIGPSGVLVLLFDNEEDTIVSQSTTISGKYEFNGITAGKYYLKIDNSAFVLGGPLSGQQSCVGVNDANNMIDNDDNGSDTTPNDVLCSPFTLTNTDPMAAVSIEYIDFCFNFVCEDQNQVTSPSCEAISSLNIICDISTLDNYCSTMPMDSSAGNQPSPLCDGFSSSENMTWFAFVAGDGTYSISITPFDCQIGNLGQQGIQVGIYTDCTFSEAVFCSDQCTINPINISSHLLNPGQIYYLYINGCNGNVCSYQIDITGNPMVPSFTPNGVCIFSGGAFVCEDLSYCPQSDITFQAQGVNIQGAYTWSITTISGDPYLNDPAPITNENLLTINIPTEGKYLVCLTSLENACIDEPWTGNLCRELSISFSIPIPMDEDFGEFMVCEDDLDEFSVAIFANEDPNGDGDSGWNALIPDYMIGVNEATVFTEGCSYEQQFTLSVFPPSPIEDVLITVCEEDLPLQVDYLTFSVFTFSGQQTLVLNNVLLQNSQDVNGCDSIINLTVEKLTILQGFLEEPVCTTDGIVLQFNYINDLSTDISFLDFVWTDPFGNILPFESDPTTIIAPFESGNGEYTLEIAINKNGVTCNYSYSTFFEIATFLPPNPTISGPSVVCSGDNSSMYSAQGDGEETLFIWSFPNDVTSSVVSGNNDEIITIDWTGSSGGQIFVVGQNICGQSDQSSYNVQVIPKSTPSFSIDTSICIGNPANIDFIGTGINITDYTWNFDGGSILSGSGMGPYEVSWDNPGEKFVSLFTTDTNGCISNTTIKSIPVQMPLAPTEVECISSIGEVIFTWEIPLMVLGFEVNVLSGQTGGVFAANSFTVSNLAEGELVTIELLTKPEDPICGAFVSTIVSCIASDCTPPEIDLEADQSVCIDDENITIEATITSGETGSGLFTGPGIVDATNGIFDPNFANLGLNTILYSFTSDVANCVGSKTITIEVFDLPVASFTQDLDTMCLTNVLHLDYTGTINAETYDWDFGGGIGSGLLTDQEVTFDTEGIKTIRLQVTKNGCISNLYSSSVLVEPEIDDIVIQCDTAGTDFVIFSWNTINGVSIFEIKIDNNPSFFSPNTTITIDELEEDQEVSIFVTSLSTTSCPGSTVAVSCTTSITPVAVEDDVFSLLRLYPNPVKELLFLEGVQGKGLSFNLFSILGSTVKKGDLVSDAIDLSEIPSGLYIIRITDDSSILYKDFKVVKE